MLLVNADDFGMYEAINEAVVRAFREGILRSTSLMVPCPGASQAIRLLRENPDIRFGVHLSVKRNVRLVGSAGQRVHATEGPRLRTPSGDQAQARLGGDDAQSA